MEVPALYPELSGIQNLRMAATARKVPKERVEELAVSQIWGTDFWIAPEPIPWE